MLKLQNDEVARFVIGSPKDVKGDDATVESGTLKAETSNEAVFTVEKDEKDPDNAAAFKVVAKRAGVGILTLSADADLGEGVKSISKEIAVEVTGSEAVGFDEPTFTVEKATPTEEGTPS